MKEVLKEPDVVDLLFSFEFCELCTDFREMRRWVMCTCYFLLNFVQANYMAGRASQ